VVPHPKDSVEGVKEFVASFLRAENGTDLSQSMSKYADRVEYFNDGWVNREFVRKDKADYRSKWINHQETLKGAIRAVKNTNGYWIVNYPTRFRVQNAKGDWIEGDADNSLRLVWQDGAFSIVHQNVLVSNRTKGVSATLGSKTEDTANLATVSMVGLWRGPAVFRGTDGTKVNTNYTIIVSRGEKTVQTNWNGSGRGPFTSFVTRRGDSLKWSITQGRNSPEWRNEYTLQLSRNNQASLVVVVHFIGGRWKGTNARAAGELIRR